MKKQLLAVVASFMVSQLFAARPVAAWDVVPYQRATGVFNAGVVAFHDKDLSVQFTVNGKKFGKPVAAPAMNDRTGVKEYVLKFPAAKLSERLGDRAYVLGATVLVDGEKPYELPGLNIYANGKGTLGSKKTIWVDAENGNEFAAGTEAAPVKSLAQGVKKAGDGGTVYLKRGTYGLKLLGGGYDRKYWTLITPAPGVDRNDVKILAGRPGTEKLHFKNLNFYSDIDFGEYGPIAMGEGGKTMAWFDDCNFTNLKGRHAGDARPFGNKLVAYVTGGATYEMSSGPDAVILRGHTVKSVAGAAIPGADSLVVNCVVDDVKPNDGSSSTDLLTSVEQYPDWTGNLIVYGLKAVKGDCRICSLRRMRDSAFVDVSFECVSTESVASSVADAIENVLFRNFSLKGQIVKFALSKDGRGDFKPVDVIMSGCEFDILEGFTSIDGTKGLLMKDCKYKDLRKQAK